MANAARALVPDPLDQEAMVRAFLEKADDEVLICRQRGPRHGFDPLVRTSSKTRLRNTWAVRAPRPAPPGASLIVQRCGDCRLVCRVMLTGPDRQINLPAKWKLIYDDRYKPKPGTGRVPSRMALREAVRRANEDEGFMDMLQAKQMPMAVLTALATVLADGNGNGYRA